MIVEPLVAIPQTDPQRKYANVNLELFTASAAWEAVGFRVDTGASVSLLSWDRFGPAGMNLDFARLSARRRVELNVPTGGTLQLYGHTAEIRVRFPTQSRWVFSWGVLLVEGMIGETIPLLGIGGRLLSDVAITFQPWSRAYPGHLAGSVAFDIRTPPTVPLPTVPEQPSSATP